MKRRTRTNLVCSFFLLISLSINLSLVMGQKSQNTTIPVKVGVVLDDLDSSSTKVWLSCIEMALSDFYTSRASSSTRLALSIRDSREDVVDAAAAGFSPSLSHSLSLSLALLLSLILWFHLNFAI